MFYQRRKKEKKCLGEEIYFLVQISIEIETEWIIWKNKDLSQHSFNRQKNVKPMSWGNTHLDFSIMDFIQCFWCMIQVVPCVFIICTCGMYNIHIWRTHNHQKYFHWYQIYMLSSACGDMYSISIVSASVKGNVCWSCWAQWKNVLCEWTIHTLQQIMIVYLINYSMYGRYYVAH